MIALGIVQLGRNKMFQLDQISGGVLHLCYPLPWWIKVLHLPLLMPMVVVSAGTGALLLWYLIMGDTLKLASLWVLDFLFVAGVLVFVWNCSACSCLESTKMVSCAWVRLWDNMRLMLVSFTIASLYSIAAHASACSASSVLTWASVSCVWFSDTSYPWAAAVAFLQIW